MLRDYCPKPKKKQQKRTKQPITTKVTIKTGEKLFSSFKLDQKWLIPIVLLVIIVSLLFLAIKTEITNFYQLSSDERILLVQDNRPLAILFFDVGHKQLVLTDLDQNLERGDNLWVKAASLSSDLQRKQLYAFLFKTTFDQVFEYPSQDLSRVGLEEFFAKQLKYAFFLKDHELLWREQAYDVDDSVLQPIFDCPVVLVNTTGETGLAAALSYMLEKSAFSIIRKDNNNDNLAQTKVVYNPTVEDCEHLLNKLSQILPTGVVTANQEESRAYRASMVIYIGRDLADLYVFFIDFFHGQL